MIYDFIVFGGTGQQGSICARDLLEQGYKVLLLGRNPEKIQKLLKKHNNASFCAVDLRNQQEIAKVIRSSRASVVINCAELIFNVAIMRACLETGKCVTDLGGLHTITREQFKLDNAFRKKGILCLTGCGSTPGISNVMASYAADKLDSIDTIMLGFAWDSNIKQFVVPYSLPSIFKEFRELPVVMHNGKFVKSNRMHCQGTFDFETVGKQTAYCIVHSEVYTFAKYFKDRGLKNVNYMAGFPEHSLRVIHMLMDLGFDSEKDVSIQNIKIRPLDFTIRVLKRLPIPNGYDEVENVWVNVFGKKAGITKEIRMECIVKTVKGWEDAGSNINTGRTIAVMSAMLKEGFIGGTGVQAPEAVVPHAPFFAELKKRGMNVFENGKRIKIDKTAV